MQEKRFFCLIGSEACKVLRQLSRPIKLSGLNDEEVELVVDIDLAFTISDKTEFEVIVTASSITIQEISDGSPEAPEAVLEFWISSVDSVLEARVLEEKRYAKAYLMEQGYTVYIIDRVEFYQLIQGLKEEIKNIGQKIKAKTPPSEFTC